MKSPTLAVVSVVSVATLSIAHARPMHAGINYERYLQVKDNITSELDEWLSKYEEIGLENGWVPASEARSADEVAEDRQQRFFMTKELLTQLEKEQPDAQFTTDTPFSLLTEDEFATYVRNSYLGKSGPALRGDSGVDDAIETEEDDATPGKVVPDAREEDEVIAPSIKINGIDLTGIMKNLDFSSFSSLLESIFKGTNKNDARRLQTSKDWSSHACNAPPQQQGSCGACWAFATVGAVETAQCLAKGGSVVKYSEQQPTSCDRTNYGCSGGTITAALKYIQQTGLCTNAAYPYSSGGGRSPTCATTCQKTQVGMKGISRVSGESGLTSALNKQPVVIAVHAGNSVWKQYKSGVVASCPNARVDHAVIAIGYDASSIKIKNSWGTRWGESGYIRLKRGAGSTGTCGMLTDMQIPQM